MESRNKGKRNKLIILVSLVSVLVSVSIIFPLVILNPQYYYMSISSVNHKRGEYISGNYTNLVNIFNNNTYNIKTTPNPCLNDNISHNDHTRQIITSYEFSDASPQSYPNSSIDFKNSILHADSQYHYFMAEERASVKPNNVEISNEFKFNVTGLYDNVVFRYSFKSWIYVYEGSSYIINESIQVKNLNQSKWETVEKLEENSVWYSKGKFNGISDLDDKLSEIGGINIHTLNQTWLKQDNDSILWIRFLWYIDMEGKDDRIEHYAFIDRAMVYTYVFESPGEPLINIEFNFDNILYYTNYYVWFKASSNLSRYVELQGKFNGIWTKLADIGSSSTLYKEETPNLQGLRIFRDVDDIILCNQTKQINIFHLVIAPI